MNSYSQMPLTYLKPQYELWQRYLSTHQTGNIFFLKNTGIIPRILQFADFYFTNTKVKIDIIDLEARNATDPFNLEATLKKITKPVVIIARDLFLLPGASRLEKVLEQYYVSAQHGVLIIHECAPHELYSNYERASCLYVHPTIYKLPTENMDITTYIKNTSRLWKIKLTTQQIENIRIYCGNIPWLINEYIRLQSENPKLGSNELQDMPSLASRVKSFYSTLPSLYHLHLSFTRTLDHNLISEIKAFGLVNDSGEIIGAALNNMSKQYNKLSLQVSEQKILFNNTDITIYFSPGERRILSLFHNSDKSVFTREIVGTAFYGEGQDYSDWALSQIMTRLRTKLKKHQLPINIIAKRGVGYGVTR